MYRFRLIDEQSGADLGPFVSHHETFADTERLGRTPGERFTVVNIVDAEDRDDIRGYVIVRRG